jgi:hypothetical protein
MPSINNYSFTNVQYTLPENSIVYTQLPYAELTIVPDLGYTAVAADFSSDLSSYDPAVQSVTFTQNGLNVLVTVTFVADFIMPSNNYTIPLCVTGSADIAEITIGGRFSANTTANVTGNTTELNTPYSNSGGFGETELLFSRSYSADTGYYLDIGAGMQVTQGNQSSYNIIQNPTYDSENRLTDITYNVNYIYPNQNVAGDSINIRRIKALEIFVNPQYVSNYQFNHYSVSGSGSTLIYYVHGQEGATFSLNVVATNGSNFTPANNVTIPANGVYEVEVEFPSIWAAGYQSETYILTISGDLEPNFSQPTSTTVVQSIQIPRLTFTASTAGSITGFTPVIKKSSAFKDLQNNPEIIEIKWNLTSPNLLISDQVVGANVLSNTGFNNFEITANASNSTTLTVDDTSDLIVGSKFSLSGADRGLYKYEITAINSSTEIAVSPNITATSGLSVNAYTNNGNNIDLNSINLNLKEDGSIDFVAEIAINYYAKDDTTFTFLLDYLISEVPSITCAAQVNNGSAGVTDHMVDLDPAGGLIAFLVNAQNLEDKFEVIHGAPNSNFFVKKATSSMIASNNFGPFENNFGTEPNNQLPTSSEVNNIDQFIGISSGTIPTKQTEFNADTGFTVPNMTVSSVAYQQIVWWEYAAADYIANPNATLRVTGPSGTAWNILRLCCPDANCT